MTSRKSVNLSDVRKTNCKLIYETLNRNDGLTLLELEQQTGLSRPTAVSMVRALEEAGLVMPVGKKESNGGRTPFLYGINPDAFYAVGIDFEFPVSRVAVSDMKGRIKSGSREEYPSEIRTQEAIDRLIAQISGVIAEAGIDRDRLLGIGMGMPGFINLKNGMSMRFERISDWKNIQIGKRISERTGVPVYMENDVHLLFRAERELEIENNAPDALFIAIRSGIGMAICQRGHIIEGEYGNAGHIGHTVICADGPKCRCGNYGCLELYASERAMHKRYEALTGRRAVSLMEIAEKAEAGEEEADSVLREAGRYLGVGIGNAVNMFDINTVIVSSYFDNRIILESAQRELDRCVNLPQERHAVIYKSRLTEDSFALGGCKLVFRRNHQKIFSNVSLKNI